MKKKILAWVLVELLVGASLGAVAIAQDKPETSSVQTVALFKGQQVTGVSVSGDGRVFANFPKWRDGVAADVVEVTGVHTTKPYPNAEWNSWKPGDALADDKFISVQSVVAHGGYLYVLDTANPMFKGTLASPRLFVFDLKTNALARTYSFKAGLYKPESYFNDLRVDDAKGRIYITDSSAPGVIVLDVKTGDAQRVLDNHLYTMAETDRLVIDGKTWGPRKVHSDGIALDEKNGVLYIHSLTGYTLYGIKTDDLTKPDVQATVTLKTAAPDGMIIAPDNSLYYADLERHKIDYLLPDRKTIKTLAQGGDIKWADTFSIHGCDLYYTNSRIHESGGDVSQIEYSIMKRPLANCQTP